MRRTQIGLIYGDIFFMSVKLYLKSSLVARMSNMCHEYSVDPRIPLSLLYSVSPSIHPFLPSLRDFSLGNKSIQVIGVKWSDFEFQPLFVLVVLSFHPLRQKKFQLREKRNPDCQQNNKLVFIRTL